MPHVCEMCPNGSPKSADVYCEADSCYLCAACDGEVHNANRLAQRHIRRPILVEDVSEDLSAADESKSDCVAHIEDTSIATDEKSAYSEEMGSDPNMSSMSFEDNGDYDFCDFTNLGGKMPSLGLEDDAFFHPTKIYSKPISTELSWDTMMQKHLTNEVPDIEMETLTPPVSSFPSTCALADMETEHVNKKDLVRRMHQSMESDNETEASNSLSSTKSDAKGSSAESTDSTCGTARTASKVVDSFSLGDTVQSPEHRKKMRMEALARFRSKRANRSFAKRVRYECRKQLADSRPRVKGRFVKKSEMALYRKYGADYRNHMHELEPESPSASGR